MSGLSLPLDGGCRCGRVRFQVTAAPLLTMACHCTGCQRMTASAYSLSALFTDDGFAVTQGEPVIGGLRAEDQHYFCDFCMSWMFTRPGGMDGYVNVRASLFDEAGWAAPFIETWTREKLPWAASGAVHSFEANPAEADFPMLLEAYAEKIGRASP
ncbi:MAG: GFA family protein [Rhodospirillaceae bacterium]